MPAGEPLSRPQEPPGGLGAGLTHDDMAAAGQLLRGFTERGVLPKLEERIARLNLSITGLKAGSWHAVATSPTLSLITLPSAARCACWHGSYSVAVSTKLSRTSAAAVAICH